MYIAQSVNKDEIISVARSGKTVLIVGGDNGYIHVLPLTDMCMGRLIEMLNNDNVEFFTFEESLESEKVTLESTDYKQRFVKEYRELRERYNKLDSIVVRYKGGTLDFEPVCSVELLEEQMKAMKRYMEILEERAEIENIRL